MEDDLYASIESTMTDILKTTQTMSCLIEEVKQATYTPRGYWVYPLNTPLINTLEIALSHFNGKLSSLVQDLRQALQSHGSDPSFGWHPNFLSSVRHVRIFWESGLIHGCAFNGNSGLSQQGLCNPLTRKLMRPGSSSPKWWMIC